LAAIELEDCFDSIDKRAPTASQQKLEWHCPHCNMDTCPAADNCTSRKHTSAANAPTRTARINIQQGAPTPSATRLVPSVEEQLQVALGLWSEGKVPFSRLTHSMVLMGAWNEVNMEFPQVAAGSVSSLPVLVRMKGPNFIVCDGPCDSKTCQPRGQCVHIKLCERFQLLSWHNAGESSSMPDSPGGLDDGMGSASLNGACERDPDGVGVDTSPVDIDHGLNAEPSTMSTDQHDSHNDNISAATVWIYCPNAAIDLEATGYVVPLVEAIYLVNAGKPTDRGAMTWVHVHKGRWSCTSRLHGKNHEYNPCTCMNKVMDLLGVSEQDLAELIQEVEEGGPAEQDSVADPLPIIMSEMPRELKCRQRQPMLRRFCVPEVLLESIEGLGSVLANEESDGEYILKVLSECLSEYSCEAHQKGWKVVRYIARVIDVFALAHHNCEVFYVHCTCDAHNGPPCRMAYDGKVDDVFNLSNNYMFTQRSMVQMVHEIHYKGCSFNSIRQVMNEMETNAFPVEERQKTVSLPTLIRGFFGFLSILHGLPGFTCTICGDRPMALIADGTGYKVFDHHLDKQPSFGQPSFDKSPQSSVSWNMQ
jgi:hypothetical protein